MPGLLSNVFDDGGDDGASATGQSSGGDATLDLTQDLDLDLAVDVGVDMGGSYQNLDGSTTNWSNSQDIGLDADVDGTMGAVLGIGGEQSSYEAEG